MSPLSHHDVLDDSQAPITCAFGFQSASFYWLTFGPSFQKNLCDKYTHKKYHFFVKDQLDIGGSESFLSICLTVRLKHTVRSVPLKRRLAKYMVGKTTFWAVVIIISDDQKACTPGVKPVLSLDAKRARSACSVLTSVSEKALGGITWLQ